MGSVPFRQLKQSHCSHTNWALGLWDTNTKHASGEGTHFYSRKIRNQVTLMIRSWYLHEARLGGGGAI